MNAGFKILCVCAVSFPLMSHSAVGNIDKAGGVGSIVKIDFYGLGKADFDDAYSGFTIDKKQDLRIKLHDPSEDGDVAGDARTVRAQGDVLPGNALFAYNLLTDLDPKRKTGKVQLPYFEIDIGNLYHNVSFSVDTPSIMFESGGEVIMAIRFNQSASCILLDKAECIVTIAGGKVYFSLKGDKRNGWIIPGLPFASRPNENAQSQRGFSMFVKNGTDYGNYSGVGRMSLKF